MLINGRDIAVTVDSYSQNDIIHDIMGYWDSIETVSHEISHICVALKIHVREQAQLSPHQILTMSVNLLSFSHSFVC